MTGTLINTGAVLLGTLIGVALGSRLPEGIQKRVLAGLGLLTILLGVDLGLAWESISPLYVVGAILLGGIVGEAIGIEAWLERLGRRIEATVSRGGDSPIAEAFVTASLLFCVGPLTVVGSLQDGLSGNVEPLAIKSALDGVAAIALAATLGWGVGIAAVTVLLLQGALTLGAGLFEDILVGDALAALTSAGGLLIVGIGLKLLDVVDVRVGNFLPALVLAPAFVGLASLF